MNKAECQCGHLMASEDRDTLAAIVQRHYGDQHPEMNTPELSAIRKVIGKAGATGSTPIFLVYPRQNPDEATTQD